MALVGQRGHNQARAGVPFGHYVLRNEVQSCVRFALPGEQAPVEAKALLEHRDFEHLPQPVAFSLRHSAVIEPGEHDHRVRQGESVSGFLGQTPQRADRRGERFGTKLPYAIYPTGMEDSCEIILGEAGVEDCGPELSAGGGMQAQPTRMPMIIST